MRLLATFFVGLCCALVTVPAEADPTTAARGPAHIAVLGDRWTELGRSAPLDSLPKADVFFTSRQHAFLQAASPRATADLLRRLEPREDVAELV